MALNRLYSSYYFKKFKYNEEKHYELLCDLVQEAIKQGDVKCEFMTDKHHEKEVMIFRITIYGENQDEIIKKEEKILQNIRVKLHRVPQRITWLIGDVKEAVQKATEKYAS